MAAIRAPSQEMTRGHCCLKGSPLSEDWAGVGGKGTTHPLSQWDSRFCLQTRSRAGRKKHLEEGGGSGKDGGDTEQGRYRGAGGREKGLQAQAGPPGWGSEHPEQRSGFQGRKDTKLRQWVGMRSERAGQPCWPHAQLRTAAAVSFRSF